MAREMYVIVDDESRAIGASASIMGAKKISAMNGWHDDRGMLHYGAIYKASDLVLDQESDVVEVTAPPVAERAILGGKWSWTDRLNQHTVPYSRMSQKAREAKKKEMKTYRSKYQQTNILLPKDLDEAIKRMDPESKTAYIVGLIRQDLRERGYIEE